MAEKNNKQDKNQDNNDSFFGGEGGGLKKAPKFNVYWVYILIIAAIFFLNFFYSGRNAVESNWQEVKNQMLAKGEIKVRLRFLSKRQV
jgi:hypothetical protein